MANSFLKWAGGKHWLVNNEGHRFPKIFNRYIEPFLGGGSVFFYIAPENAVLSDINEELINTYVALRDDLDNVYTYLRKHQCNNSKEYYYKVRESNPRTLATKAARMIYLNKSCFNGIYRVNKAGKFNVPYGTERILNFEKTKFSEISKALSKARIICQDFEATINNAEAEDFLFCDPPYAVIDENNRFIGYNADQFTWEDQERLARCLIEAKNKGVLIMMTNVDHPKVRSLYDNDADFKLASVDRKCVISGSNEGRKTYRELIVTANY
mgnify:CR=1 FL=1